MKMDFDKTISVILYILNKLGPTSKTKLMKLLFFADFAHMQKFKRPITWSKYYRLIKGPVPSYVLDVINTISKNKELAISENDKKKFMSAIKVTKEYWGLATFLRAIKKPDMEELSISDREILDKIIVEHGHKNAIQLSNETHKHPAWQTDLKSRIIRYSNVFPDGKDKEFSQIWEKGLEEIKKMSD